MKDPLQQIGIRIATVGMSFLVVYTIDRSRRRLFRRRSLKVIRTAFYRFVSLLLLQVINLLDHHSRQLLQAGGSSIRKVFARTAPHFHNSNPYVCRYIRGRLVSGASVLLSFESA